MFEDTLVPMFEEFGRIYDLRIMMDPMTGMSKGYAFLTYCELDSAKKASEKVDYRFVDIWAYAWSTDLLFYTKFYTYSSAL